MTRVSDKNNHSSVNFQINRLKQNVNELHTKGSTLKRVNKPSDDPIASIEAMNIDASLNDNKQYIKNSDHALLHMNIVENVLAEVGNILVRAKELAVSQSSSIHSAESRKAIANEVKVLKEHIISLANKQIGNKYIFSGYKTTKNAFDKEGNYLGDNGKINIEIAKDFFVPTNFSGKEMFFIDIAKKNYNKNISNIGREIANNDQYNIFKLFDGFIDGLNKNDTEKIKSVLEPVSEAHNHMVTLRSKVGANINRINHSKNSIENSNIQKIDKKSQLVDADIAKLFSDIAKQQSVLKAAYKVSNNTLNQNLMDFINI